MKNLKLNKLVENQLSDKEMSTINGGYRTVYKYVDAGDYMELVAVCGCGCYYANTTGSSTEDNTTANFNSGLFSKRQ